jgi:hypothetical protein
MITTFSLWCYDKTPSVAMGVFIYGPPIHEFARSPKPQTSVAKIRITACMMEIEQSAREVFLRRFSSIRLWLAAPVSGRFFVNFLKIRDAACSMTEPVRNSVCGA